MNIVGNGMSGKLDAKESKAEEFVDEHHRRQSELLRRVIMLYGTRADIAKRLNVDQSTVSRWARTLEEGGNIGLKAEKALTTLTWMTGQDEDLILGFHGAMYSLPALIAVHRCRVQGFRNTRVATFTSPAAMAAALASREIQLAVINPTFRENEVLPLSPENALATLVGIGDGPVTGIAGKKIENGWQFSGMKIFVPAASAFGERLRREYRYLKDAPSIVAINSEDASTMVAGNNWSHSAFIGWPDWVKTCARAIDPKYAVHSVPPDVLPRTPAVLVFNKDNCPRASLRQFLVNLDAILADLRPFTANTDWDLGDPVATEQHKEMIRTFNNYPDLLNHFKREEGFFNLVSFWNAEIQMSLASQ